MEIDPDLDRWLRHPLTAGTVGALIGLRWAPGLTWPSRMANVLAGSLTAAYFAPALAQWLRIDGSAMHGALSFAVGLFGLNLCAAGMQALRELKVADIIASWLSRR